MNLHLFSYSDHQIRLLKVPLNDTTRERACVEVIKRFEKYLEVESQVMEYTEKLLNTIKTLNKECLTNISQRRKTYFELLKLTKKAEVTVDEFEEIRALINSTCQSQIHPPGDLD